MEYNIVQSDHYLRLITNALDAKKIINHVKVGGPLGIKLYVRDDNPEVTQFIYHINEAHRHLDNFRYGWNK